MSSKYIWESSVPRRVKLGKKEEDDDGENDGVDDFDDIVGIHDITVFKIMGI